MTSKNRLIPLASLICVCIFLTLLAIRIGCFEKPIDIPTDIPPIAEKEQWFTIYQNNQKIGYSHRVLDIMEDGYHYFDLTFIRIKAFEMIQDMKITSNGDLRTDLSLSKFRFELQSNKFRYNIIGTIEDNKLEFYINDEKNVIELESPIYLPMSVVEAAFSIQSLTKDNKQQFLIFDPITMQNQPVTVSLGGNEILSIMGKNIMTTKVKVDYSNLSQVSWVSSDGLVVKEKAPMGLMLVQVTEQDALEKINQENIQDIGSSFSIPSNLMIDNPETIQSVQYEITGISNKLSVNGSRQTLIGNQLIINKETLSEILTPPTENTIPFLKPSKFIQSDHPKIIDQVNQIISHNDSPQLKIQKLLKWIYDHIKKQPVMSVPNALETLTNKMGDCNEHAVLMAAFARAAGIPSQIETGLVYLNGRFYYHAWNVVFIGQWITVDSTLNQMPADVFHIRLVRGNMRAQIDIMSIIGKLELKIIHCR